MGVLLFTDADVFAGTEQHMLDLALGLRGRGVDISIACPVPGALAARASKAGIDVVAIAKSGRLDWRAIRSLRRLLKGGRFEIIHAHNGRTAFLAAIAVRSAGVGRCVATQHFLQPCRVTRRGIKAWVSKLVHRWVDRQTDHVIAISHATCRGSIVRGEAAKQNITVVPNGIAPPDLAGLRSPAIVREELKIPPAAPLVVCAARLEAEKDVATLIDAMRAVVRRCSDATCLIAGDGRLRGELQQRIEQAHMESSVRLLGFRSDVMSIIHAADIFVLPSLAEPFGLVLLEAMSLGKPVIATAVGGPLEIVVEGRTGLLVPPRDPAAMATAIQRLIESAELRHSMGQAGQARYREEFTSERMAAATAAVYRRVLQIPSDEPVVGELAASSPTSV